MFIFAFLGSMFGLSAICADIYSGYAETNNMYEQLKISLCVEYISVIAMLFFSVLYVTIGIK